MIAKDTAEILVVSVPDSEGLVGELWFENEQWARLYQADDDLVVEFNPRVSGKPWVFRYDDAAALLRQLRSRLLEEPVEET